MDLINPHDRSLKKNRDIQNSLETAYEQSYQEGVKQAREEIVIRMTKLGYSTNLIAKGINCSLDEVINIQKANIASIPHFITVSELNQYAELHNISKDSETYENSLLTVYDNAAVMEGVRIEAKINIAQRLLNLGYSIEQTAQGTGLSAERVRKIQSTKQNTH